MPVESHCHQFDDVDLAIEIKVRWAATAIARPPIENDLYKVLDIDQAVACHVRVHHRMHAVARKLIGPHIHDHWNAAARIEVNSICRESGIGIEIQRRQLVRVTVLI